MGIFRDLEGDFGIERAVHYDEHEDRITFKSSQDCETILRRNVDLRNSGDDGYSPSRELKRVASIPLILVEKWLLEEGINVFKPEHMPRVLEKLDDPQYSHLRTSEGRVSKRPHRYFCRASTASPRLVGPGGKDL